LKLVSLVTVGAQSCIVDADNFHFDFTPFKNRQVSLVVDNYDYVFTFCGTQPCGDEPSSLCQTIQSDDINNLGVWTDDVKWQASTGGVVSGQMFGSLKWCPAPRITNVTFQCGVAIAAPRFISITETDLCYYEALIQVPYSVCNTAPPCCTTPTYSSTRLQSDGSTSVAQADAVSGNWFDSNFQGKGQSVLCSTEYSRCFTFTPTTCVGSEYRPAPSQCFGKTPDWTFVKEAPVYVDSSLRQTAWFSRTDGYVVTMPFGDAGHCVVVSGNKVDTSFEFSLTPNSTLWNVPKSCIRALKL